MVFSHEEKFIMLNLMKLVIEFLEENWKGMA